MEVRSTLALTFLLGSLACGRGAPTSRELSSEDVVAIRNLQQTWMQAIRNGNWAGAAEVHAEDAVRLPPDGRDERGRAAILASVAKMERPSVVEGKVVEIEGCSHLAYAWTNFSVGVPAKGSEKPTPYTGRDIVIFRKQEDGRWLVSRVIWNSDQPSR
jgi:uncharacterized protein (TIGR02246 family)